MSRGAAAWHEAGHLAAGFLMGGQGAVGLASIKPGHWHDGLAEASLPIASEELDAAWWAATTQNVQAVLGGIDCDRVEREVVVLLAGTVAEIRAAADGLFTQEPRPSRTSPAARTRLLAALDSGEPRPTTDLDATDELLRRITTTPTEAAAYREMLIERTHTFASMNPRFWPLVEALAHELLIHDELTADEVAAVIAQVNGEEPPRCRRYLCVRHSRTPRAIRSRPTGSTRQSPRTAAALRSTTLA